MDLIGGKNSAKTVILLNYGMKHLVLKLSQRVSLTINL